MNRRSRVYGRLIAVLTLLFIVFAAAPAGSLPLPGQNAARRVPTVEDLMGLKSAGSPAISPDGTRVAYTVTETDYDQDAYVTQIWLSDVATGRTFQLTRGKKSCAGPDWSPDGRWLTFTSSRADDKSQVFVI